MKTKYKHEFLQRRRALTRKRSVVHLLGNHSNENNTTYCNIYFTDRFSFDSDVKKITCKKCLDKIKRMKERNGKKYQNDDLIDLLKKATKHD